MMVSLVCLILSACSLYIVTVKQFITVWDCVPPRLLLPCVVSVWDAECLSYQMAIFTPFPFSISMAFAQAMYIVSFFVLVSIQSSPGTIATPILYTSSPSLQKIRQMCVQPLRFTNSNSYFLSLLFGDNMWLLLFAMNVASPSSQ